MMKNLFPFLAAACLTLLVVGAGIVLTDNYGLAGLAAVATAVTAGGFVATWWFAPDNVNMLMVVQTTLRWRKLAGWSRRVWIFWGPRVTNTVLIALIALDAYIFQEPTLKAAIESTKYGWALLLALHLFATIAPRGAPERIPAPGSV